MTATFFTSPNAFRKWLTKNHLTQAELLVGFYKVNSNKPSITWSQAVDQALCFGWIDGVRKSIDHESYCIRFTPRKNNSVWSSVNIKKIKMLTEMGLMRPAGINVFELRNINNATGYSHETKIAELNNAFKKIFSANKKAWAYFQALAPSYRKTSINWVMTAKQETTQLKRLHELMTQCEKGTNQFKDNKYKK